MAAGTKSYTVTVNLSANFLMTLHATLRDESACVQPLYPNGGSIVLYTSTLCLGTNANNSCFFKRDRQTEIKR